MYKSEKNLNSNYFVFCQLPKTKERKTTQLKKSNSNFFFCFRPSKGPGGNGAVQIVENSHIFQEIIYFIIEIARILFISYYVLYSL